MRYGSWVPQMLPAPCLHFRGTETNESLISFCIDSSFICPLLATWGLASKLIILCIFYCIFYWQKEGWRVLVDSSMYMLWICRTAGELSPARHLARVCRTAAELRLIWSTNNTLSFHVWLLSCANFYIQSAFRHRSPLQSILHRLSLS